MATVNRWTGVEVHALRQALRLSVRDFASRLGVDRRSVNKWDARGSSIVLLPLTQSIMDTCLAQTSDEVRTRFNQIMAARQAEGRVAGIPAARNSADTAAGDPMNRRTLIKFGLASTVAGSSAHGQVGTSDVGRIKRTTARLHGLDQQHGGETIWQAALSSVNEAYRLLEHGSYGSETETQLLRATARLQVCAGWLCFDAGRHEQARTSYMGALMLARPTGDAEVETRALANLAFQSNLLRQPREALRFAHAAEDAAARFAREFPRVAAIPQLRLATANSLTGDAREADRAITLARRALDDERAHNAAEWCTFLSPLEIDAVEATCAVKLGDPTRAERLLERAVESYSDRHARNRALYRVRLAHARLERRIVDGAAEAAEAALDDLECELDSWRVSVELEEVARRLAENDKVAGVAAFLHRYAAMDN
ncbi:helix-turn-helix domain-containing protein [Actinosynnema sp. ALI-1.44]|uniref:helix-turn-helix domain-containing protein n=1 Tax=Actinosynnema sp. ALI-1.44 TaxID=1933779 RepID=UPI001177EA73|nr:hypothetical protein [Actinosynnema sp. ALI-1.44]